MLLPSTYLIIAEITGKESGVLYYLSRTFCGIIIPILAFFLLLPRMIYLIIVLCLLFFVLIGLGVGYDRLDDAFLPDDIIGLLRAILRKD